MANPDLFERYVHEVARGLPKAERADLARELRSMLEDALAERRALVPGEDPETAALEVLVELGPPDRMAERYGQPRRSLIGPESYPAYATVLKVVLGIVTVLYAVAIVLSVAFAPAPATGFFELILKAAFDLGQVALVNFGLVTLIFAGIERAERAQPEAKRAAEIEPWDPRELPPIVDPERLDRGDLVFEIAFLLVLLVVLNTGLRAGGSSGALAVFGSLTPAMEALVPWLNGVMLVELTLNVFVLARGRWQRWTRALDIGVNLVWLVLLAAMLRLPAMVDQAGFASLAKLAVSVVWVFVAVELAQQLWRFPWPGRGGALATEASRG